MCTAMGLKSKNNEVIFGRTMDFSYELDPEVYIIPKDYKWVNMVSTFEFKNRYKIIGTGQDIGSIILVDGINEMGLGAAALYFQDEAKYDNITKTKTSVGSIEMVHFLLGHCKDVPEVLEILKEIEIIGIEDPITNSVAPLHWYVIDKNNKCIVIEKTKKGLVVYNNEIKVLSNSPTFDWHLTNLRNYLNFSTVQKEEKNLNSLLLTPFGQGGGSFGLPGDFTSPSRFVRVTFLKNNILLSSNTLETINDCFNIMKSVFIPKGVVQTKRKTYDYTQYITFMNTLSGTYYFNTYNNNQIFKANINDSNSKEIVSLGKLKKENNFKKTTI